VWLTRDGAHRKKRPTDGWRRFHEHGWLGQCQDGEMLANMNNKESERKTSFRKAPAYMHNHPR
jgi:hypothetical protein